MKAEDVTRVEMIKPFVLELLREANMEFSLDHGARHCLERVPEEARCICETNKLGWTTAYSLDIAAKMHDPGYVLPGPHAKNSADMFLKMPLENLWPGTRGDIAFAILHHPHGLAGLGIKKAGNSSETLLGLLCMADHADNMGGEGAIRTFAVALSSNPPLSLFSSHFSAEEILQMMKDGAPVEQAELFTKDSVVAGLAFQWQTARSIMEPVEHLLNEAYRIYWNEKRRQTKAVIDLLLREQNTMKVLEDHVKLLHEKLVRT